MPQTTISGDALAEMQSRLDALSRSQAIAEFDVQGFVHTANANYLRIMGFSSLDEIKGSHHTSFCEREIVYSSSYTRFWEDLRKGVFYSGVYKRFGKSGKVVWLQASYNPIFDASGCVVRIMKFAVDITEQKLRDIEAEGRLHAINKSQAMIEFDPLGNIIAANSNYCKAMGYVLEEILGKHHRIFCEPDYVNSTAYGEFWDKLKGGEFVVGEFKRIGRDGQIVFIEASYNPILDANGRVSKIVKFATDVTRRRQIEAQNVELAARARAASEASQLKTSFLAMISHELRTPLGGIMGMTYILRDSPLPEASQLHIQQIHDCAQGLLLIVNDILDVSKIEAGKMQFEHQTFDIRQEVQAVCDTNRPAIAKRGLRLKLSFAEALPHFVKGDPMRLRQVLNNLLGNAVKFSASGEIHVSVEALASIHNTTTIFDVTFKVCDQGMGVDQEDIKKLFVPFSQVDSTIARRFGGTGLGLSICRALVEGMGGTIGVVSEGNRGSEFWFRLPLEVAQHPLAQAPAQTSFPALSGEILLVEDNAVNQTVVSFMLRKMGLVVQIAANGKIALEMTETHRYDAIVMDCQMPEMDGFEATYRIRQREMLKSQTAVPIIALTANAMPGEREKCIRGGMDEYLSKPVVSRILYAILANYLPSK